MKQLKPVFFSVKSRVQVNLNLNFGARFEDLGLFNIHIGDLFFWYFPAHSLENARTLTSHKKLQTPL